MKYDTSNTQKNRKALLITLAVHSLLLLLFFLFSFKTPDVPLPPPEEGIEVNLGNSDIGFGDVQPLQPGEPAPAPEDISSVPAPAPSEEISTTEKETTQKDEPDVPEISKPTKKTAVKEKPAEEKKVVAKKETTNPVVTAPKETKPRPKALFTGGNGSGGNGQDSYNNSTNQGIAGGNGDQGKPGGNPNSDSYSGNGGNGSGGPRVIHGNRKIVKAYSFEGELDKATIYALIKVSPSGKGTWQDFGKDPANGKKSTSRNKAYKDAIINYLTRIQFNPTTEESLVTVKFEFSIRD